MLLTMRTLQPNSSTHFAIFVQQYTLHTLVVVPNHFYAFSGGWWLPICAYSQAVQHGRQLGQKALENAWHFPTANSALLICTILSIQRVMYWSYGRCTWGDQYFTPVKGGVEFVWRARSARISPRSTGGDVIKRPLTESNLCMIWR